MFINDDWLKVSKGGGWRQFPDTTTEFAQGARRPWQQKNSNPVPPEYRPRASPVRYDAFAGHLIFRVIKCTNSTDMWQRLTPFSKVQRRKTKLATHEKHVAWGEGAQLNVNPRRILNQKESNAWFSLWAFYRVWNGPSGIKNGAFAHLMKKFLTLYGTRRFITVFKRVRYWTLSRVRWIHSVSSHTITLRSILILFSSSRGQPTRGGPPAWRLGVGLTTPHRKKLICYEMFQSASDLDW